MALFIMAMAALLVDLPRPVRSVKGTPLAPQGFQLMGMSAQAADMPQLAPRPAQVAPQRPGTLPGVGWQSSKLDGAFDMDELADCPQGPLGAARVEHASYLLAQLATQAPGRDREALGAMARLAETMAVSLRQAGAMAYDDAPNGRLAHLRLRNQLMSQLRPLRSSPMHMVTLTPTRAEVVVRPTSEAGSRLRAFQAALSRLESGGFEERYPQTYRRIREEAHLLERLALGVELRWESTSACADGCPVTRTRIYARQEALPLRAHSG